MIDFISNVDMFTSLIGKVHFSEQGTADATNERATYTMFLDLLYKIESESNKVFVTTGLDKVPTSLMKLKVLSFCTGSKYSPPLGFDEPITVRFDSTNDLPLASTCAMQLTLPSKCNNNSSKFKENMVFALLNHRGLGLL